MAASAEGKQAIGFSTEAYIKAQTAAIQERLARFAGAGGRLLLEVGGHVSRDGHASRVLPGFEPRCKVGILKKLLEDVEHGMSLIFCLAAPDVASNRNWMEGETYLETTRRVLAEYAEAGLPKPHIAFNLVSEKTEAAIGPLRKELEEKGYKTFVRRMIDGYPNDLEHIVSPEGYGKDDHITTEGRFVVVTGLGSNCGKLSTCLGQVYQDHANLDIDSGYCKYELFPIWQLLPDSQGIHHPINLAYEAATADIGDYVCVDTHHEKAYGKPTINYNRDVDAFPILRQLVIAVSSENNPMREYKSPTDMGINHAFTGITDQDVCIAASIREIESRIERFSKLNDHKAVELCKKVLEKAKQFKKN